MLHDENLIISLYQQMIEAWNRRKADDFATLYEPDGYVIGFDGSEMNGQMEIASTLSQIFADHPTAPYVAKVREVRFLTGEVAILRAIAGMPKGDAINPAVNAIHTLVAKLHGDQWRIALFQNTPAQLHGRPEEVEAMTQELGELL